MDKNKIIQQLSEREEVVENFKWYGALDVFYIAEMINDYVSEYGGEEIKKEELKFMPPERLIMIIQSQITALMQKLYESK